MHGCGKLSVLHGCVIHEESKEQKASTFLISRGLNEVKRKTKLYVRLVVNKLQDFG